MKVKDLTNHLSSIAGVCLFTAAPKTGNRSKPRKSAGRVFYGLVDSLWIGPLGGDTHSNHCSSKTLMKLISRRTTPGLVALVFGLAAAIQTQAGVIVTLSETGFAPQVISSASNPAATGTPAGGVSYGTFSNVQINSSSLASSASDAKLQTTIQATRNSASSTDTLSVTVTADPFSSPSGNPLDLKSSLSDSTLSGAGQGAPGNLAGVLQLTSSLASPPFGSSTSSPTLTLMGLANANQAQSATAPITPAANSASTYQLESAMSITLGAGQSTSMTATTDAIVPEPSAVTLVAIAFGLLGAACAFRRFAVPRA